MLRLALVSWLAAMLAACGSGDGAPGAGGSAGDTCDPADRGSASPGDFEAEITRSLREQAGLERLFGEDTQRIFDEADALRAEAGAEMARDAGLPEPPEAPALAGGGLCAVDGLTAQVWAFRQMSMAHASASLPQLIQGLPISGRTEGTGLRANETGDPRITARHDAYYSGDGKSSVTVEVQGTTDIVSPTRGSVHENSLARATIDVCPDEAGKVQGKVHFSFAGLVTPPAGATWAYGAKMDATFGYQLDDQAEVENLEIEVTMTYGGSQTGEVTGNGRVVFAGAEVTDAELDWDRDDASLESIGVLQKEIFTAALMVAVVAEDDARKRWRDGTCVEIHTDRESGSVAPFSTVQFTATARQKFTRANLDVDVDGRFEGVGQDLQPYGRSPSPVQYTYTAASAGAATLYLESISKRGIGTKELVLTAGEGGWSGRIDVSLQGSSSSSAEGWTYTYEASGSGFIAVRPGSLGLGEVDDASFEYRHVYTSTFSGSREQGGCTVGLHQVTTQTLAGSSTENAVLVIAPHPRGLSGGALVFGLPNGTTHGDIVTVATESRSGSSEDCQGSSTNRTEAEVSGGFPPDSFLIEVESDDPNVLSGTRSFTFGDGPPRNYEVTFDLRR